MMPTDEELKERNPAPIYWEGAVISVSERFFAGRPGERGDYLIVKREETPMASSDDPTYYVVTAYKLTKGSFELGKKIEFYTEHRRNPGGNMGITWPEVTETIKEEELKNYKVPGVADISI